MSVFNLITRINLITEEMSVLQKEKRRLVKRLMESKKAEMASIEVQTERTVHPHAVYNTDVIRTRRT